jgi:integrase/recombinase XerC
MKTSKIYPFKKAILRDRLGDLTKRWYIEYQAFDVQLNSLVKKYEYEVNKLANEEDRRSYSAMRIKQIDDLLVKGYHFDTEKSNPIDGKNIKIIEAYWKALEIKQMELSHETMNSYRSTLNVFSEWLQNSTNKNVSINQFGEKQCYEFIDSMAARGVSPRTINSRYVDYLKAFHNTYMSRNKEVKKNPWIQIKKKKEIGSTRNIAFNHGEIEQLKALISSVDKELWIFIQFIYYLFLRPNEIRQLQAYNILLSRGLVFIDAKKAKNKKDSYITIPPAFLSTLKTLIEGKHSMSFLFPGSQIGKPISKNVMAERFKALKARIDMQDGHTFYSWKHTGVIMAYNAGIDIKSLQKQLRHHSLEETDTYLRSLGLIQNNDIIVRFPSL